MSKSDVDDWEKPRSHGTALTKEKLEFVRTSFIDRVPIETVARKLKCSSRTVTKYYGYYRAEGVEQKHAISLRRE